MMHEVDEMIAVHYFTGMPRQYTQEEDEHLVSKNILSFYLLKTMSVVLLQHEAIQDLLCLKAVTKIWQRFLAAWP